MFFPILIQELSYLGNKIFLEKPDQEITKEVKELINFLEKFSNRSVGDMTTPEIFIGKYTKCSIRIVATKYAREFRNIDPAKNRIENFIKQGCENVYIIGSAEKDNKTFMDEVVGVVLGEIKDLQLVKEITFNGQININGKKRTVETYFVHLHNPKIVQYVFRDSE